VCASCLNLVALFGGGNQKNQTVQVQFLLQSSKWQTHTCGLLTDTDLWLGAKGKGVLNHQDQSTHPVGKVCWEGKSLAIGNQLKQTTEYESATWKLALAGPV
jgi:hypothetical protein